MHWCLSPNYCTNSHYMNAHEFVNAYNGHSLLLPVMTMMAILYYSCHDNGVDVGSVQPLYNLANFVA